MSYVYMDLAKNGEVGVCGEIICVWMLELDKRVENGHLIYGFYQLCGGQVNRQNQKNCLSKIYLARRENSRRETYCERGF